MSMRGGWTRNRIDTGPVFNFTAARIPVLKKNVRNIEKSKVFLLPYASHVSDCFDSPTVPFLSRPEELNIDYPKKNSACFLKMFIRND